MKKVNFFVFAFVGIIFICLLNAFADELPGKPEAWKDLYEQAKKEGEVIFNPAEDPVPFKIYAETFEKRFPGIKVRLISVGVPQIQSRIITEARAGKVSMDVTRTGLGQVLELRKRDLLHQFDWTGFGIPKEEIFLDGTMLYHYFLPWVIYYNHDLVSAKDAPKTWEDLLDPKWKGKMCFHRGSPNITGLATAWEDAKWMSFVDKLSKQEVMVGMRGMDIIRKIAQGERVIGNNSLASIVREAKKGAPFTVAPISPQGFLRSDLVAFKGGPHPNAAKLFMAWTRTAEGKETLLKTGMGYSLELQKILKEKNIEGVVVETLEQHAKMVKIEKEWYRMMGFAPRRPRK